MPFLRKFSNYIVVGALGFSAVGCVSAEEYAAVRMQKDQLAEQLGHSQTEVAQANARADSYSRQLQGNDNSGATKEAMLSNQATQIAELQKQYDLLSDKYQSELGRLGTLSGGPALNPILDSQLKSFASQNPDLVEFDSSRGMVKFKSDVTFATGETALTPKAREVLNRFAAILTQSSTDGYELLIAGHTDSRPVTNESVIHHGNFDNWFLSSHRAISVSKELIAHGVSADRMGVVGYADKRPVASNATPAGQQLNRRVEVLILPTPTPHSPSMASAEEPKPHRRTPVAAPLPIPAAAAMNKDTPPTGQVTFTK